MSLCHGCRLKISAGFGGGSCAIGGVWSHNMLFEGVTETAGLARAWGAIQRDGEGWRPTFSCTYPSMFLRTRIPTRWASNDLRRCRQLMSPR